MSFVLLFKGWYRIKTLAVRHIIAQAQIRFQLYMNDVTSRQCHWVVVQIISIPKKVVEKSWNINENFFVRHCSEYKRQKWTKKIYQGGKPRLGSKCTNQVKLDWYCGHQSAYKLQLEDQWHLCSQVPFVNFRGAPLRWETCEIALYWNGALIRGSRPFGEIRHPLDYTSCL